MSQITDLLDAYDAETANVPLGHENKQRGKSTYNWRRAIVDELRVMAAEGVKPPPTAANHTREIDALNKRLLKLELAVSTLMPDGSHDI
jgi:hypothetical protein